MSQRRQTLWQKDQIAYCSNVHPGESWQAVNANLSAQLGQVRSLRQLPKMASGLWLSNQAAEQLSSDDKHRAEFSQTLVASGIGLTSLNGFPYGNFHQDIVKQNVYLPTWAQPERLAYSQKIATLLAEQFAQEIAHTASEQANNHTPFGAISTLPLGYKVGWTKQDTFLAVGHLLELVVFLEELEAKEQVRICFGIEMEPDCVLESTHQLLDFFQQDLLPQAVHFDLDETTVLRYLGCCFDTCHQSVMREDIQQSLSSIHQAGIPIVKIQISNALSATIINDADIDLLCQPLTDSKFLHQCKIHSSVLGAIAVDDLNPEQLREIWQQHVSAKEHGNVGKLDKNGNYAQTEQSLRCNIHYHVPIHLNTFKLPNGFHLDTTQEAILTTLDFLAQTPELMPYLEIETYTWLQLLDKSPTEPVSLATNLVQEFAWLEQQMTARKLIEKQ